MLDVSEAIPWIYPKRKKKNGLLVSNHLLILCERVGGDSYVPFTARRSHFKVLHPSVSHVGADILPAGKDYTRLQSLFS